MSANLPTYFTDSGGTSGEYVNSSLVLTKVESLPCTQTTCDIGNGSNEQVPDSSGKGKSKRKKRVEVTKREQQRKLSRVARREARYVIQEKCSCHLSCLSKMTFEHRVSLNERYWQMDHKEQKYFIRCHSVPGQVKRRRVLPDPLFGPQQVKKSVTYSFFLPDEKGEMQTVCCGFFLNTLGYRKGCGNHIYRAHMKEADEDKRGKYRRDQSLRDAIWDDILSYSPRTYHKGSKFSATAIYLPSRLNAKMMHADFKARREAIGEKAGCPSFYCMMVREIDLHFVEMDDFVIPERKPLVKVNKSETPPPMPTVSQIENSPTRSTTAAETEITTKHIYQMPPPDVTPQFAYPSAPQQTYQDVYQYPAESKPVIHSYPEIPPSPNVPFQPFEMALIKQEPYYNIMSVESVTVPEHSCTDENDDFSDSYTQPDADFAEAEYSQPTHLESKPFVTTHLHVEIDEKTSIYPPTEPKPVEQTVKSEPDSSNVPSAPPKEPKQSKQRKPRVKVLDQPVKIPDNHPPIEGTKRHVKRVHNFFKRKQTHPVVQKECTCHLECRGKISHEHQARINDQYWSMGFADQRMFTLEHTERHAVKRRRTKLAEHEIIRKGYTYSYRLTDENGKYQTVCCQFYLNTIGFDAGSGNIIYRAHNVELSKAITDKRGRFARDTTLRDSMDDDILSYFSPEQQSSRGVLDLTHTDWTPKKMFNQYVQRQAAIGNDKPGSFGFFWRRTRELKVKFNLPEPKTPGSKKRTRQKKTSTPKEVPLQCLMPLAPPPQQVDGYVASVVYTNLGP
ncbi:uncharacterized protein LOC129760294 [Uranotaenia lowii]|uniref:uncharacterized protein LOC129760294 n=1 Tax=Uranotaenia lowii TaxID=190385 RepID=UPI00247B00E8|nr:uncharacterized protein LOC129760294 [Uranotaenia lowii]